MTNHCHHPTVYYSAFGTYPPALRIADGDSVVTTTVDSRGFDHAMQKVTLGGNAQSGPFYVEGAEPGDTLAVHLDSIRPNRRFGRAATVMAARTIDPEYVAEMPRERVDNVWDVDPDRGTATFVEPKLSMPPLTLQIEPMIGCFGVAPPGGQAISTATSSTHGGNMDYRGFTAGVTVYFPVFVPGALFSVGDGHAVQGDGEVVGNGIEISMEVRFTLRVIKGKLANWPRAESDEFIMTVGNARPLDQALQHATTEMLRWLQADYGLDARGACTLLGQCVRYDIANVCDPAYTVVCKVAKRLLAR